MPELQLEKKFKVYYCARTAYGVRFYYLVHEGLLLHPNIVLTPDIEEADVVVYLPTSSPWHKSECGSDKYYSKLLVLDEGGNSIRLIVLSCVVDLTYLLQAMAHKCSIPIMHRVSGTCFTSKDLSFPGELLIIAK